MASPKTSNAPPKLGIDAAGAQKLAMRVETGIEEHREYAEPKHLDPSKVLVGNCNRLGAPINSQYVHNGILKSFKTNAFDPKRPKPGICVHYKTPEGIRKLLDHNQKFTRGNRLLPPIDEEQGVYGSLGGSHLNAAFRLLKAGSYSPLGYLQDMLQ